MDSAIILAQKILEMLIYLGIGFFLVKIKLLRTKDSRVLSGIALYVLNPCMMIVVFQNSLESFPVAELGVGLILAVIMHFLFLLIAFLMKRGLGATTVETNSVIYTNCINLLLPVASPVIGAENTVYLIPASIIFTIFVWTHGFKSFNSHLPINFKKIFLNINILAIVAGFLLTLFGVRLPEIPMNIFGTLGSMLGPVTMLMTGVVMGGIKLNNLNIYKRLPLVFIARMIVCPGIVLLLFIVTNVVRIFPQYEYVFFAILLAACAPSANITTQMAVMYGGDSQHASVINIVTTIPCIITMSIFVMLFEKFC